MHILLTCGKTVDVGDDGVSVDEVRERVVLLVPVQILERHEGLTSRVTREVEALAV
jgi:hypothetical protein